MKRLFKLLEQNAAQRMPDTKHVFTDDDFRKMAYLYGLDKEFIEDKYR